MELEVKSESEIDLGIDIGPDFMEIDAEEELDFMGINDEENKGLVFVDIQGFRSRNNHFICKEFCLVSTDETYHTIVKSPYKFERLPEYHRRQANWLTRFFHGLTYDCGDVRLIDVLQTVYPKLVGKKIIVKGIQKVGWLKYMFRNCGEIECVNIEDLGYCKTLHDSPIQHENCNYHKEKYWRKWHCALEIALKLQEIVANNKLDV